MNASRKEVASQLVENLPHLRRYALALSRNPAAADDLVQECAGRALTKAHLYKPNTNLRAWLFTILHNLHVSECRRQAKQPSMGDPDAAMSKLTVGESQSYSSMWRKVRGAMARLPDDQAAVLTMIGVEGRSYQEVSEKLDLPVGTVKSRCFRAREALQRDLGEARPALMQQEAA